MGVRYFNVRRSKIDKYIVIEEMAEQNHDKSGMEVRYFFKCFLENRNGGTVF